MKYNDFESHHSEITTVNLKVTLPDVFMDTHTIHTHIQNPTYLFINLSTCCFATCFFSSSSSRNKQINNIIFNACSIARIYYFTNLHH